jgi:DNA-directed RNA polymerase specialized sigma24 family protein
LISADAVREGYVRPNLDHKDVNEALELAVKRVFGSRRAALRRAQIELCDLHQEMWAEVLEHGTRRWNKTPYHSFFGQALNLAKRLLRSRKLQSRNLAERDEPSTTCICALEMQEDVERVTAAVSPTQFEALRLVAVCGCSYTEVGRRLGVSCWTARRLFSNARTKAAA